MKAKKLLLLSSLTLPLIISSCSTQNSTNNNNQPNDSKVNQEETITSNPNPLNEPNTPKEGDENSKTQSDSIDENKTGKNVENKDYEHENSSEKEVYKFPKPEVLSYSLNTTLEGNLRDPKLVFDKVDFPNNVILENNLHNINLSKIYFEKELEKILDSHFALKPSYVVLPKWFTKNDEYYSLSQINPFSKIPDLVVRFKDQVKLTKYVKKIMPINMLENELVLESDNSFVITKDISNFSLDEFKDKNIEFIVRVKSRPNQFDYSLIKIKINLDNIVSNEVALNDSEINGKYQVSLENNILKIKVKLENKQLSFDETDVPNKVYLDKYNTLTMISYLVDEDKDQNFSLGFDNYKNQIHPKISSNGDLFKNYKSSQRLDASQNNDKLFENIRKRVFVVGGGTSTMIAKVKPNDINDHRYYFLTNRHVSDILQTRWSNSRVMKKFMIHDFEDDKISSESNEISIDVEKDYFEFNFWEAKDQTNRKGILKRDNTQNADISISIIDIQPILQRAKNKNMTRIISYFESWKDLKPLKLSKATKFIESGSNISLSLASFPQDNYAGFMGRRYREHIINNIDYMVLSDQAPEYAKYGHFKSFALSDRGFPQKLDLTSGASGSLVYDKNGDIVAVFMQNIDDNNYGFGLLASHEFDYFGYETTNNPNSFKHKLEAKIKENPNRFEMIEL
ncbi:hypothetical protein [Mycoplasmopsis edwardii]|uniref:Uncharacterized protein n=1 Tax=Mycoplasmopsis edwardii TaxID=53558 RepID=A0ACD4PJH9_9BACT|nr:hypothetical protein [Mycoplasmopsis edwardii]WBP84308.1 hypothetical protein Me_995_000288 [Mycoplasmopsis edwardii]